MKIGIEVQRLFRKKKFGIETSALELIKTLSEVEPNNEYVVFVKDDQDQECLNSSDNVRVKKVGGKLFMDFEQLFLPIAADREHVDILHCTGNTTPFFSPAPVVQTLHDVIFMDPIPTRDSLYQLVGNHYRRKVVPVVTPRSKAVITVSQYEKDRISQRLGIERDKIHVVYNGLNEKRFHNRFSPERRMEVRAKYNLPANFILFLGNEATRKNPDRVIEAYVKYATQTENPLPLVTPGLSVNFVTNRLRALNFAWNDQLFITPGYIADEDLPVLYGLSHLFLFPSLSEGFGMPLVEAMACGSPVITSSTSCLPEIAGNAALLANPLKTDEIASAIHALSTDSQLRNKKITAGILNSRRFSWKHAAESVLSVYENVHFEARTLQRAPGFFARNVFATRH